MKNLRENLEIMSLVTGDVNVSIQSNGNNGNNNNGGNNSNNNSINNINDALNNGNNGMSSGLQTPQVCEKRYVDSWIGM